MSDNSYAQLIDDFDAGIQVLEGETLTEYIKRMGGVDYESKADGGAIGIEVLFNKKANGGRVGFVNGGWAEGLEGEALSIYNSMNAYGASDAEIQSKLQGQNLWSPTNTTTDTGQVTGIINQDIGGGGGGIGGLDLTFTEGAKANVPATFQGDYDIEGNKINELGRTGILGLKDKAVDFFSGLGTPRVRGTLGTRLSNQPRLPLPASMASWSLSPFNTESRNYNENFAGQLNFLEGLDNMIGRDQGTGLLRYGPDSVLSGKNVISGFGTNDYQKMLNNYIQKMNANKKISETGKAAKIAQAKEELAALLEKQKADRQKTNPNWTPPSHYTEQGGGGYQDKSIHSAPTSHSAPSKTGHMGPGGKHYNTGGLATMFTRRR